VDQLGIGQRPVARVGDQAVAFDQRIQAVPRIFRIEAARQLHRAQHPGPERDAGAPEFAFQEAVVEARVVRDEQPALEPAPRFVGNRREGRGVGDHRVADAGQLLDEGRNRHARRDQLLPLADAAVRVDLDDADFRDAVDGGSGAGGFEVDEGEGKHDRTGSGGGGG